MRGRVVIISHIYSQTSPHTHTHTHTHGEPTAAAAKLLQTCPTLCDPIDGSPPGSPIPRILQARTLEWVDLSFSNAWKWKVKAKSFSCIRLFTTPWTAAYQAPPSMGFSRQEYWSGMPSPSLRQPTTPLLFLPETYLRWVKIIPPTSFLPFWHFSLT